MARHTRTEHLEYRRSGFVWRRRIPQFSRFDPQRILRFALRSHDAIWAREIAAQLTSLTSLAFDYARIRPMQPTELHQVISRLVRWKLDEADTSRRLGLPRCVQTARREQERYAACDTLRRAILLRNYEALREPIRYALDQLGLQVAEASPDWQQIGHEAAHALLDATKEISRRDRGEFDQPSAYFRAARHSTERVTDSMVIFGSPPNCK